MAARVPRPHASHRRWPLAEKRRLVELTLRPGASARAVADEHGVHQNTLDTVFRVKSRGVAAMSLVASTVAGMTLGATQNVPPVGT
jgi:transposase-like protein